MPDYDNNSSYEKLKHAATKFFAESPAARLYLYDDDVPSDEWFYLYGVPSDEWFSWWHQHVMGVSPAYLKLAQRAIFDALYEKYMPDNRKAALQKFDQIDWGKGRVKEASKAFAEWLAKDIDAISDNGKKKEVQAILGMNALYYECAEFKTRTRLRLETAMIVLLGILIMFGILYYNIKKKIEADDKYFEVEKQFDDAKQDFNISLKKLTEAEEDFKEELAEVGADMKSQLNEVTARLDQAKERFEEVVDDSDKTTIRFLSVKLDHIVAVEAHEKTMKGLNIVGLGSTVIVTGGSAFLVAYKAWGASAHTLNECREISDAIESKFPRIR